MPASKLIEVIIADASAGELRELAPQWVTALGKTPVVVKNRPGFASSRLGLALGLEAMRMVEEGIEVHRRHEDAGELHDGENQVDAT